MSDANTNGTGGMWPGKSVNKACFQAMSADGPIAREHVIMLRRAAIQQLHSCDRALGWQTRVERVEREE